VERFSGAGKAFIVLAHAALPTNPGKGPLNNPSPGQDMEPRLITELRRYLWGVALELTPQRIHDVEREAVLTCRPSSDGPSSALVSQNALQARKGGSCLLKHEAATIAIVEIGRAHNGHEQVTFSVNKDVALTSCDLLAAVKPACPTCMGPD
jgi:hypothetical protein